jgi:GTP-binding protein
MQIIKAKYLTRSPSVDKCPKPDRPEYAFIGRSNVGKSSLINLITTNKKLAKISATPGKTRLINHFEITATCNAENDKKRNLDWYLADLPGYGFAKVSQQQRKNWEKMIEDYIRKRRNLVNLFVLIDSRHKPMEIDLEFVNQLGKWQIPFVLVFTKSDKNKPGQTEKNVDSFMKKLKETWSELPRYFITSTILKTGKKEILDYINNLNRRVE